MPFPVHFPETEFRKASDRALDAKARANAERFANQLLQPLRRAMGFPVYITAFWQQGGHSVSSTHKRAEAIDIGVEGNDRDKLQRMFEWLATYKSDQFGKLIDERDHLHVTLPGVQNAYGEVWREPVEGEYVLASVSALVASPIAWFIAAAALYLLSSRQAG